MVLTTCLFALVVILAVIAIGGTGMATGGRLIRERRLARRRVQRSWATQVANVGDGSDIKLVGTAHPLDDELSGPFSRRRCVAYELTVFDFEGARPVLLARVAVAQPFLLRDATGAARVVPDRVQIGIEPDKRWRLEPQRHDSRVTEVLERTCPDGRWRDHTLVVCEGVIEVGGQVAVCGRATREPDPERGDVPYRTLGSRPLLTGTATAPLCLVGESL